MPFSGVSAGILSYGASGKFGGDSEALWFYGVMFTGKSQERWSGMGSSRGHYRLGPGRVGRGWWQFLIDLLGEFYGN